MPKRRTAAAVKTTKRPRADVHRIQKALADRLPDAPGIIVGPFGSGKPRMAGKLLDRIVPERVAALKEDVQQMDLEVEIVYGVLKRSSIICIIYAVVSFTAMRDAFAHHTRLGALRIGKDCVDNTTRLGRRLGRINIQRSNRVN